jgi:hypothetical protein
MPELDDKFVPETIFAIRFDGKWYVKHSQCTATELRGILVAEGLGDHEVRILRAGRVNPDFVGHRTSEVALRLGWVRHWNADNWYPMEEPMPWLPGHPQPASVAFMLTSIPHGGIAFDVKTTSQTIGCQMDDINDSLVLFARFAQLIRDGGCPQAALVSRPRTFFVVQAMPREPGRVRLFVSQKDDDIKQRIDIHLHRSALLDALRTFLNCIAYDQTLGHMFLCFCEMRHGARQSTAGPRMATISMQSTGSTATGSRPCMRCRLIRPSTSRPTETCFGRWRSRLAGLRHRIGFREPVGVSGSLARSDQSCQADSALPTAYG